MKKYLIKTTNGKFMSAIYTLTLNDFECLYQNDAKKFDSREEAQQFIDDSGFDKDFVFVIESTHGGRRPGAGNPGTKRVAETRVTASISIRTSVLNPFKKKYGRTWSRKVEAFMEGELT